MLTNHHCVTSCIESLSSAKRAIAKSGYYAGQPGDEIGQQILTEVLCLFGGQPLAAAQAVSTQDYDDAVANAKEAQADIATARARSSSSATFMRNNWERVVRCRRRGAPAVSLGTDYARIALALPQKPCLILHG